MAVYQCFFFSDGYIRYWENIERQSAGLLRSLFQQLLSAGEWDAAEAWDHDELVCRVGVPSEGRIDRSPEFPSAFARRKEVPFDA